MTIKEKIQGYLRKLELDFEEVGDNTWLIRDDEAGLNHVIVYAEEPLVIIRVKVMGVPSKNREHLFEDLLRLNGEDLVHGAYALEGDNVILLDTLEHESMDLEEFQASLDAVGLALAQHYPLLAKYMNS